MTQSFGGLLRRCGALALLLNAGLLAGCSEDSRNGDGISWSGEAPFGRNEDGTPRNETVSERSATVDDVRLWNNRVSECLRDAGYEIEMIGDGRLGYQLIGEFSPEQYDAYLEQNDVCIEEHPFPGLSVLSPEEWERLYVATVRQADCFEQRGVQVSEPPSMQTWVDSMGAAWSPMADLPDALDLSEEIALMTACPSPG